MKKLTRKLFISILSMAFAVIAIGTTTFAWITVSTTATIKPFNGTVEAGVSGIELSTDGGNTWQSSIDLAELITDTAFAKFSDITTSNGAKFYEYSFSSEGADSTELATNEKYIEVSFLIRRSDWNSSSGQLPVYVENVVFESAIDGNDFGYELEYDMEGYTKGETYDFLTVANAARLLISIAGGETVVYEQAAEDGNTVGYSANGFAHLYWSKKNPDIALPQYSAPAYGTTLKTGDTSGQIIGLGDAEEGYEVIVRVWIEGFDNECHAKILGQSLTINFGFTTTAAQGN